MQILVSSPVDGNAQARVSTFFNKHKQLKSTKMSLDVPYYVYNLNVKLESSDFYALIDELKNIDVKMILDAEAARYCGKKYNKELDCILDHIIEVG